jgi:prepilin-type N-terminal cleavage/methylation domain-containing protein
MMDTLKKFVEKLRKSNKAFTLAEVMISTLILGIGLLTFYSGRSSLYFKFARIQNNTKASILAGKLMAEGEVNLIKLMKKESSLKSIINKRERGVFKKPTDPSKAEEFVGFWWERALYQLNFDFEKLFPSSALNMVGGGEASGSEGEGETGKNDQKDKMELIFKSISKLFEDYYLEMRVKVYWKEKDKIQSYTLITHVADWKNISKDLNELQKSLISALSGGLPI